MSKYTVILLRPDFIADNYGLDVYFARVEASSLSKAIKMGQTEVRKADGNQAKSADYAMVAVFSGEPTLLSIGAFE